MSLERAPQSSLIGSISSACTTGPPSAVSTTRARRQVHESADVSPLSALSARHAERRPRLSTVSTPPSLWGLSTGLHCAQSMPSGCCEGTSARPQAYGCSARAEPMGLARARSMVVRAIHVSCPAREEHTAPPDGRRVAVPPCAAPAQFGGGQAERSRHGQPRCLGETPRRAIVLDVGAQTLPQRVRAGWVRVSAGSHGRGERR